MNKRRMGEWTKNLKQKQKLIDRWIWRMGGWIGVVSIIERDDQRGGDSAAVSAITIFEEVLNCVICFVRTYYVVHTNLVTSMPNYTKKTDNLCHFEIGND